MAKPSNSLISEYGFFHALSKTLTKEGQYPFESPYNAGHVMLMKDILAVEIPYFENQASLDLWMATNPGILTKYENFPLTEVKSSVSGFPTTDEQAWYIEDNGKWIKPIILGAFAADETTNAPSSVLEPLLYRDNGTQVPSTMGVWWVDPFQGLIRFGYGYEPNKSSEYGGTAIGTPHITCYAYTGDFLKDILSDAVQNRDFVYEAESASNTHVIDHYLNSTSLNTNIYEDNGNGGWAAILASVEHTTDNRSVIQLSESMKIKATFRKIG